MSECPGRVSGSKRLRGDLERKVARQVATAVDLLHSCKMIHGDLTPSNILFRVSDQVHRWSVDNIYEILGSSELEEVVTCSGSPPGPLEPISQLSVSSFLQEGILLID
ncbi:hypothetical protein AcV5_004707 [Taiwanofungus camphoratus]|nr:hypothetical protein AcV5_004707 [Antrodia cinnamomea]